MRNTLFEFEDLPWFPSAIRQGMVDYLAFFLRFTGFYKPIVPLLARSLDKCGTRNIVDLCSGSGGPIRDIAQALQKRGISVTVTLTDKFPNLPAWKREQELSGGTIGSHHASVDAADVPVELSGLRTCFSAFHHFDPAKVKAILGNAMQQRQPIAIFDGGDRNILAILGIIIVHPILFLFCTPFLKPFRWDRLLFTYLLPIIPFCTVWDGVVSITRLYTLAQLREMTTSLEGSYEWETGRSRNRIGLGMNHLIGVPGR